MREQWAAIGCYVIAALFGGLAFLWLPSALFAAVILLIGLWYQRDAIRDRWR